MATVVIQVGQCGNQIGTQLFSILQSDAKASSSHGSLNSYKQNTMDRFFTEQQSSHEALPVAKAVLVDMEPKAIQSSIIESKRSGSWLYNNSNVYSGNRGSGNNWANGFMNHGPRASMKIFDIVQSEIEKCNHLEGFVILMSVAGGTGSGMGTYITELLKDECPKAVLINPIIWPYTSGEVIVQNYNGLLTTSHLSENSDAIFSLLNDDLHQIGSRCLRLKEVSFTDMNKIIGHSIASILQPAVPLDLISPSTGRTSNKLTSRYCSLADLCSHLTPHPSYKFLTVKTVPQMPDKSHDYTVDLWPGLLKRLKQMLITNSPIDEGMNWSCKPYTNRFKSLANLLIVRGKDLESMATDTFKDEDLYCRWVPESMRLSSWGSDVPFNRYEKSCSLVSNNASCRQPLDRTIEKAWKMYCAKAYIHQYQKFGLSEEHFMEAFVKVEQLLKDYSIL